MGLIYATPLAAACALLVEIVWAGAIGTGVDGSALFRHLGMMVLVAALAAIVGLWQAAEAHSARLMLALPSILAVAPALLRRLGIGPTTIVVGVVLIGSLRLAGWRHAVVTVGVAAVALVGASVGGPAVRSGLAEGDPTAGPPVVLIVLDTVRADHLAMYGYHRRTMPELEAWANDHAAIVDRAISNSPGSLGAHASLFTGRFPVEHGAHRPLLADSNPPLFGYPLRQELPTLASVLGEAGYVTAGISANLGPVSREIGLGLSTAT